MRRAVSPALRTPDVRRLHARVRVLIDRMKSNETAFRDAPFGEADISRRTSRPDRVLVRRRLRIPPSLL